MNNPFRSKSRRPRVAALARLSYTVVLIGAALVVVMAALPQIGTPPSGRGTNPRVHLRAALTSGGPGLTVPYSPGELYSGGSEVEASAAPQGHSGTAADNVDPTTGNLNYTYDGFSTSTVAQPLDFNLSYNSEFAQANLASGITYGGPFGFGWSDSMMSNLANGSGVATLYQPSGATSSFGVLSGSCPSGYSVQTVPGSTDTYCGVLRQNAQFGDFPGWGFEEYNQSGGLEKYIYNVYGQLTAAGNPNNNSVLTYHNDVAVGTSSATGAPACPSSVGSTTITSCNQVVDLGQREITFAFNAYGGVAEVIDPDGNDYVVNVASNQLGSVIRPGLAITSFGYAGTASPYTDDLTSTTDPNQFLGTGTSFAYNSTGMVTQVTSALGSPTTYGYTNTGCPTACLGAGDGQVTTVTYPDGDVEKDYYTEGLMTYKNTGYQSTSNPGEQWTYTHNSYDEPTDMNTTDPMGRTSNNVTDAYGNALAVVDPEGHTTSKAYNSFNEVCWSAPVGTTSTSCADPPPDATVNSYDQYGNLTSTVDPLGHHTTKSYDAVGELISTTDPNGNTSKFTYYASVAGYPQTGDIGSTTDPLGNVTTHTFDKDGLTQTSVSPLGNVTGGIPANFTTTDVYNSAGWLTSETTPGSRTTTTSYDADGNVVKTVDPAGYTMSYGYDTTDRQCWSFKGAVTGSSCASAPTSNATLTTYFADTANPLTVTDPAGNATTYQYGDLARPNLATEIISGTSLTAPVSVISNVYDADGETCLTGSAAAGAGLWDSGGVHTCGWQTNYTFTRYNQDGSPIVVEDPAGNETIYNYDNSLLPTLVTKSANAIGVGSTYTYDVTGQLLDATDSAQNTTSYAYDPNGNLCWKSPTFASSDCGSPPSGTGVTTYAYDADGHRSLMTDNAGTGSATATAYTYDANSQVLSTGAGAAHSVGYAYDTSGDVTCIAYPSGTATASNCASGSVPTTNPLVAKAYNADGQVTSVQDWNSNTTAFGYYGVGLNEGALQTTTYPTSPTAPESVTYGVNPDNQVTSTAYAPTSGGVPGTANGSWSYQDGLMSSATNGSLPTGSSTYDPKHQVLTNGSSSTFNYGTVTNESELHSIAITGSPTITDSFNAGEELTSSAGSTTTTFGYDQNGNRCWSSVTAGSGSCASPPSGASTYAWNAYHQLTASNNNAMTATYAYNGDGLRTTDLIASATQNFVWDQVSNKSQPLTLEDSNYAYIYGATTTPIEQIALSTQVPQYLSSDPGGVHYVFASANTLSETLNYSTFGTPTTSGTGTTAFGFQGSYIDSDGLVYLVNRYYDPATAQFLSVDPDVATTGEPYAFTGNDPLNETDPLGLQRGWWYKGNRSFRNYRSGAHFLPTEGQRHYVAPKSNRGAPVIVRGNPVDRSGNVWQWDSSTRAHGGPHFDVQHPGPGPKNYTNVAANGNVLHGPDKFPNAVGAGEKFTPSLDDPASVKSDGSPTPYALAGGCSGGGTFNAAFSPGCLHIGTPAPIPFPTPGGGVTLL